MSGRKAVKLRVVYTVLGGLGLLCLGSNLSLAADDPCEALGKLLSNRAELIQVVQAFHDKKPTADEACAAFTKLSSVNSTSITAAQRDGSWCHAPDTLVPNLKSQQSQIDKAKSNACKVAADMKKAPQNAGPPGKFGGSDGIVGGELKLPQGAL